MPKPKLKLILSLTLATFSNCLLLSGCALTAPVPDVPACVELSPTQGWCTMTVSSAEFYIDSSHPYRGHDWIYWRSLMAMLPPDSYAAIKNYILGICETEQTCQQNTPAIKKKTQEFESHMRTSQ